MLQLIYRQWLYDRIRVLFTCGTIAAVIAVILTLEGFREGLYAQLRAAVLERGADLLLTQAGVANLMAARSVIPQLARAEVEAVDGVAQAYPLTALPVIFERGGRRTPVYLLVYDVAGGPVRLIAGAPIAAPRQIVIDESLADRYALAPGDDFTISGFRFSIAGVSTGTAAMFTPFAFITYDDLIDFYLESELVADLTAFPLLSFLLVELRPQADAIQVARAIEAGVASVDAFQPSELADNDENLGRALFGPILGFLVAIGYLIGVLAVGIFMFTAVNARSRAIGVMRALGITQPGLARLVIAEAVVLMLLAFPLGVLLAEALAALIHWLSPLYRVLPAETAPLWRTAVASLGFALVGALLPVRATARLDPSIVFRS